MRRFVSGFVLAVPVASSCAGDDDASSGSDPVADADDSGTTDDDSATATVEVIGRGEYVTGGDVLLRYEGPESPSFTAGGVDLSAEDRGGGVYLVGGLPVGPSVIEVGSASVEVVNGQVPFQGTWLEY